MFKLGNVSKITKGYQGLKVNNIFLSTYFGGQTWMAVSLLMLLKLVCMECVTRVRKLAWNKRHILESQVSQSYFHKVIFKIL